MTIKMFLKKYPSSIAISFAMMIFIAVDEKMKITWDEDSSMVSSASNPLEGKAKIWSRCNNDSKSKIIKN
jgi:hypothetical protein